MPNILIDGYNVIGTIHKNLEKARRDLVGQLSRYASLKGHNITVVFDGWKNGQAEKTKERRGGIDIIYSSLGETADLVIKDMLSASVKAWIVVSSDREIYNYAKKKSYVALTRDEFKARLDLAALTASERDSVEPWQDKDSSYETAATKKGNPRKLSKNDRRKMDAIKKL